MVGLFPVDYDALFCSPQILPQMPPVHRHTFVFLITFMKKLLDHSFSNGLEPKVLGKESISLVILCGEASRHLIQSGIL